MGQFQQRLCLLYARIGIGMKHPMVLDCEQRKCSEKIERLHLEYPEVLERMKGIARAECSGLRNSSVVLKNHMCPGVWEGAGLWP